MTLWMVWSWDATRSRWVLVDRGTQTHCEVLASSRNAQSKVYEIPGAKFIALPKDQEPVAPGHVVGCVQPAGLPHAACPVSVAPDPHASHTEYVPWCVVCNATREAVNVAQRHGHHGYGEYSFCPLCLAELAEQADEAEREHDARVDENVAALVTTAQDAYTAVSMIGRSVDALVADYDIELVEGADADDIKHELGIAERALRNVERIAQYRAAKGC